MADILIKWATGDGNIVVSESGGDILISSDTHHYGEDRTQRLTFRTTTGNAVAYLDVTQKADGSRAVLVDSAGTVLQDKDANILLGNL